MQTFVRRGRLFLAGVGLTLAGCTAWTDSVGYGWQAMTGHLAVVHRARPIEEWLSDPQTPQALRERLSRVQAMRAFASSELGLPDNGSYRRYADLGRPFVVWNVFAAPELSLRLHQWCWPVVGCVGYRGYYDEHAARDFASRLGRREGLETHVGGVPAYSTLGWFDDPVLNTFIGYPEGEVARLLFHELAHQVLFVAGDTTFNESFATAVEEVGVARWLAHRGDPTLVEQYERFARRKRDFLALIRDTRMRLETVYESDWPEERKRSEKQAVLTGMRHEYESLRRRWGGFSGYDRFFASGPNNAQLAAIATYHELVPGFRRLLTEADHDLPAFFTRVKALARLAPEERRRVLGGGKD